MFIVSCSANLLLHTDFCFFHHTVELESVLALAFARIMHAYDLHFIFCHKIFNYIHRHSRDSLSFLQPPSEGWQMLIGLTQHRHYSVHTCLHEVVKEFECFYCEYRDYIRCFGFIWLEEMCGVM